MNKRFLKISLMILALLTQSNSFGMGQQKLPLKSIGEIAQQAARIKKRDAYMPFDDKNYLALAKRLNARQLLLKNYSESEPFPFLDLYPDIRLHSYKLWSNSDSAKIIVALRSTCHTLYDDPDLGNCAEVYFWKIHKQTQIEQLDRGWEELKAKDEKRGSRIFDDVLVPFF